MNRLSNRTQQIISLHGAAILAGKLSEEALINLAEHSCDMEISDLLESDPDTRKQAQRAMIWIAGEMYRLGLVNNADHLITVSLLYGRQDPTASHLQERLITLASQHPRSIRALDEARRSARRRQSHSDSWKALGSTITGTGKISITDNITVRGW